MLNKMRRVIAGAIVVGIVSSGALLFCEQMEQRSEADALAAQQGLADCLVGESRKVPSCRWEAAQQPEDFDFCSNAVAVCKENGLYQVAGESDDTLDTWRLRVRIGRVILAVVAFAFFILLGAIGARTAFKKRTS